jgi:hypothetical protein
LIQKTQNRKIGVTEWSEAKNADLLKEAVDKYIHDAKEAAGGGNGGWEVYCKCVES